MRFPAFQRALNIFRDVPYMYSSIYSMSSYCQCYYPSTSMYHVPVHMYGTQTSTVFQPPLRWFYWYLYFLRGRPWRVRQALENYQSTIPGSYGWYDIILRGILEKRPPRFSAGPAYIVSNLQNQQCSGACNFCGGYLMTISIRYTNYGHYRTHPEPGLTFKYHS